ncbi:prepilin-type N-terminal cleavage/methylation domain-containing protein [Romboutsia sp.]|uniref:prepilin-type N-terminal cleavage/methylation domain-containing protein n=1 Tax=Romboutsia sp. TaxID=1965302 RepID=UPI003F3D5A4D
MKNKQSGFVLIEVIISMAIICLAVYMISYSLYENYSSTENNKERIEILNTAKQYLECTKDEIKRSEGYITNYEESKNIGKYKVIKSVKKEENYYQCYKVNIEVKNNKNSIKLDSYVLQQ